MTRLLLAALLALSSCDSGTSDPPQDPPAGGEDEPAAPIEEETVSDEPATAADTEAFARSSRAFAVDLWRALRDREGNVAVSPASLSTALAMTWAGARGETASQMATTMHFGDDADALHRGAQAQIAQWNDPDRESYELRVANRIFAQTGMPLEDDFLAITRDRYGAPLESVAFRADPEQARLHINGWVSDQTNQRIDELLPEGALDSLTRMVLTNAVYFHGDWQTQFDEDATSDRPFHLAGGEDASVPTMQLTSRFGYGQQGDVSLLQMPYVGDELAMLFVLPADNDGLADLQDSLTVEQLDGWVEALSEQQVQVELPRFRVEDPQGVPLKEVLTAMGMPLPFSDAADFTAMSDPSDRDEQLHIDDVYHQVFVEVNEEGTEAAAATGVVMAARGAARPQPRPVFRADHPFLFLLRDVRSGTILFMGRVVDPR